MRNLTLAVVLLGSAGCLPPLRDNPHDTALVPVARLFLVDTGPVCPPPPSDSYPSVTEASRGRCLALDARASSDPQGRSNIESFEFVLPDRFDGTAVPPATTEDGLYVLPAEYRRALATDGPLLFGVVVRDRDGNRAEASLVVQLTNERPIAKLPPGFSVPAGGLPWSGVAPTLTIDATGSLDADGDDLHYCWTALGTTECLMGDAGRLYQWTPPTSPGRYVVSLELRDAEDTGNRLSSRSEKTVVWVEPMPLWETPNNTATTVVRLDNNLFPNIAPNGATGKFHASGSAIGTDMVVTVRSVSPQLQAFSYPDFTPGTPLAVGSGGRLHSDPVNNRIWLIRYLGGGIYRIETYGPRADLGFDDLNGAPVDVSLPNDAFGSALSAVDTDGTLWLVSRIDETIYTFSAPQTPGDATTPIDRLARDIGPRPGRDEMWVLVQDASAEFRIYTAPGAPPEVLHLENVEATFFEWIDEREFWMSTLDGLVRVDADMLRDSAAAGFSDLALQAATIAEVPEQPYLSDMIVDPLSGEVWTDGTRIAPDLSVHLSGLLPEFVDPDGYAWARAGGLRRARTLSSDGTQEIITLQDGGAAMSVDVVRGSVWIQAGTEPYFIIQEVTGEGVPLRRITSIDAQGSIELVPDFERIAVSPDASSLFGATVIQGNGQRVLHLDLETNPPVTQEIAVFDNATEVLFPGSGFHASVNAADPFVWSLAYDATTLYPVRISAAGIVRDTGISISSQFGYSMLIARSLVDDAACVGTLEEIFQSGTTFLFQSRLYRVEPGSAAVLVDSNSFFYTGSGAGSFNYAQAFVSASRAPDGGEMCWQGIVRRANPATPTSVDQLTVVGAQEGLGIVRTVSHTGVAGERIRETGAAMSPDEVWYLRDFQLSNGTFTSSARVRRHTVVAGALTQETVFTAFDHPGQARILVTPESEGPL